MLPPFFEINGMLSGIAAIHPDGLTPGKLNPSLFHHRCKGYDGDVSRPLYGGGNLPLVSSAVTRYPPGDDFAPFRDEMFQDPGTLVINFEGLIGAEPAHFPSDVNPSLLVGGIPHGVIHPQRWLVFLPGYLSICRMVSAIISTRARLWPSGVFHLLCFIFPSIKTHWPSLSFSVKFP